jgi:hypothetical protein
LRRASVSLLSEPRRSIRRGRRQKQKAAWDFSQGGLCVSRLKPEA